MGIARTVLIVDDDVLALRATSRSLRGRGYEVVAVPTMRAALRARGPFSCAVLDVNLDADSGLNLGRELLQNGSAGGLVFFSGSADEATRKAAEELGTFVNKASDFALLLRAVEHCFGPESGYSGVTDLQIDTPIDAAGEGDPSTPRPLRAHSR